MASRVICFVFACLALAACGGGGDGPAVGAFSVASTLRDSTDNSVVLVGSSFFPAGASCTYYSGPFVPYPNCVCEVGSVASGTWTNAATGASGSLGLSIMADGLGCTAPRLIWRTGAIALVAGENAITLALSDGETSGGATVILAGR